MSLLAARLALDLSPRAALIVIVAIGIAMRVLLFAWPPLLSDDVYRYIWDGRILNAGFNPFLHVPADPALASLRDEAIWSNVDKKDYAVTIYPPVAQAIFALVTRIADGLYPMKVAMLVFEALGIAAMVSLCAKLAIHPARLAIYVWHPLALWEIANNSHVDAAMMGILLAGVAWGGYNRPYRTAATFAAAALVKPFGALWLPSTWRAFDLRLPLFVLGVVALFYVPFLSAGVGILGFLGQYFQEQGLSSGTGFFLVLVAFKLGAPHIALYIYLGLGAFVLGAVAIWLARRPVRETGERLAEAGILSLTALFLLTPVYPWYFLLIAPFSVLIGSWCAFAMMTTSLWLYGFQPDQIEFIYRWSAAIALVTVAGGVDLARARRRAS